MLQFDFTFSNSIETIMATIIAQPAAVASNERIRRPRRHYKCTYCQKVFKRSEHCIRHERTHTNEKPFSCRYCRRTYSRKDLVTRHERTLHAQGQAEPSALPPAGIPAEDDESDGSLSDAGNGSVPGRKRRRIDATVLGAADDADLPPSESEPSRASSAIRGGVDSPSNHTYTLPGENGTTDSVTDEPRTQSRAPRRKTLLRQSISSLANVLDAPGHATSASQQPDVYTGLHFDVHDATSQMPMDVDLDQAARHPDEYSNTSEQNHTQLQQQSQPRQAQELYPFAQYHDAGPQADAIDQNLDPRPFAAFEPADMSSFFTFSPFPVGLFDVGQNMPNMAMPGMAGYQQLQTNISPTHTRLDAAISPASAPPAHSPSQLQQVKDHATSSGSNSMAATAAPSNLPLLAKDEPPQIPNLAADNNWHASLCKDLAERLGRPNVIQEVPSSKLLQGFLTSFLDCYYRHQPFIHLPTMSVANTPSPLILGMCCIGALYRLDRRRAERLYTLGTKSIASVRNTPPAAPLTRQGLSLTLSFHLLQDVRAFLKSSAELPLWVGQTTMLLTAYAALSGDKVLAGSVMEDNGFFTLVSTL